jgi:two-component system, cell cycle response regulator DivK
MLKTDRPDLIVMDIQLPGMDGLEATRKLKLSPATRDIPVIAVTSYALNGDREMAHAAGCAGYVTKPIDKNTFIEEVAAHLAKRLGSDKHLDVAYDSLGRRHTQKCNRNDARRRICTPAAHGC